ncbi:MAG: universal stress protein, partial [Anaerolineae bacterium]
MTPLEAGPRPGEWRQWALSTHRENHLFTDYLVPISGSQESWLALDQALLFAGMEQDYIHGLHIISSERAAASKRVETISAEFERRLAEAGVEGDFSVETGSTARAVCDSAVYADLVIMNIAHAPGSGPLKKLS